eukprot:5389478-Amphidinium_carterae.4
MMHKGTPTSQQRGKWQTLKPGKPECMLNGTVRSKMEQSTHEAMRIVTLWWHHRSSAMTSPSYLIGLKAPTHPQV